MTTIHYTIANADARTSVPAFSPPFAATWILFWNVTRLHVPGWRVFLVYPGLHAIWAHRITHWLWVHKSQVPRALALTGRPGPDRH